MKYREAPSESANNVQLSPVIKVKFVEEELIYTAGRLKISHSGITFPISRDELGESCPSNVESHRKVRRRTPHHG
jgi:hypothetical protein